jgi:SAM-dependent methyltransferase
VERATGSVSDGNGLALTGERTVPGIARENYWFRRHEAVYAWVAARPALASGPVLEAGFGEGYGAALLGRSSGAPVLGLDYDVDACQHARAAYPGIAVARANLAALPVRPRAFALAVSLQVVEHLWDVRGFLSQVATALRPCGTLVVSTPNRLTFSPGVGRGEKPTNPFHVEEFDRDQLVELISECGFEDVRPFGLHHGPRLAEAERQGGPIVEAQVNAILGDRWTDDLDHLVASVSVDDFVMGAADDSCLDLVVTGVRA